MTCACILFVFSHTLHTKHKVNCDLYEPVSRTMKMTFKFFSPGLMSFTNVSVVISQSFNRNLIKIRDRETRHAYHTHKLIDTTMARLSQAKLGYLLHN